MSSISSSQLSIQQRIVERFDGIKRSCKDRPVKSILLVISIVAGIAFTALALFFGIKLYGLSLFVSVPFDLNFGLISGSFLVGIPTIMTGSIISEVFTRNSAYKNYLDLHNTDLPENLEKPILLILRAKYDWNGVLSFDQRDRFRKLEKDYHLIVRVVQSPEEMREELNHFTQNKISVLWFQAHSNPYTMDFGINSTEHLSIDNISTYAPSINNSLKSDARIVLESCNSGGTPTMEDLYGRRMLHKQKTEPYANLALAFAENITCHSIFCSTKAANLKSTVVKSTNPLNVEFYYRYDAGDSTTAKIKNIFYSIIYALSPPSLMYKYCAENVTWVNPNQAPSLQSQNPEEILILD